MRMWWQNRHTQHGGQEWSLPLPVTSRDAMTATG
jgi:hypothetical protein